MKWQSSRPWGGSKFASCGAPCGNNFNFAKIEHSWRAKVQTQQPSLSVHVKWQPRKSTLSHLVSLPKLANSAWQLGSCQSLSTAGSATEMSNNAQRLRNTKQCVNVHAHRLLCNNLHYISAEIFSLFATSPSKIFSLSSTCLHNSHSSPPDTRGKTSC